MKPFDLEAALNGAPVVTRDGEPVTQLTLFKGIQAKCRLFGVVDGRVFCWLEDGAHYTNEQSGHDLFMAPKKRTVWVNVYETGGACGYVYDSEEAADSTLCIASRAQRIGGRAWPLEIEE